MKELQTGKVNTGGMMGSGVPTSGKTPPQGGAQTSGETIHNRHSEQRIENLNNMPTVHQN